MNYTEVTDRHIRRKQKPRPVSQIIADLKERLANETEPDEIAYLKQMLSYWEEQL